MKLIRAVVRPQKEYEVAQALSEAGFPALTKVSAFGRGRGSVRVGDVLYDEFPKVVLLLAVEDDQAKQAVEVIVKAAQTGKAGDGKIFVTAVEEAYTIRTGCAGL